MVTRATWKGVRETGRRGAATELCKQSHRVWILFCEPWDVSRHRGITGLGFICSNAYSGCWMEKELDGARVGRGRPNRRQKQLPS